MKNYLFFTTDGYSFDPNNKEIPNMQILGFASGNDILEAFKEFKQHQSYLVDFAFKEVVALEYIDEFIRHLEL